MPMSPQAGLRPRRLSIPALALFFLTPLACLPPGPMLADQDSGTSQADAHATGGSSGSSSGGSTGSGGGTGGGTGGGGSVSGSGGSGSGGGSVDAAVDAPDDASATGGGGSGGRAGTGGNGSGGRVGGGSGGNGSGGNGSGGNGSGGNGSGGNGSGGNGSGGSGSGGSNVPDPPKITNGQNAWCSRYWDCCKPACGWKANVRTGNPAKACNQQNQSIGDVDAKNACENGGTAFMCWNGAPWSVSSTLSYGFAAASGSNYVCGRCFQLQFTGQSHNGASTSTQALNGKTMIVQVLNNGGVAGDQFDLLIPGGGVGALNACSKQWGTSDLGAQYGGFLAGCNGDKNCVQQKCMSVFSGKPELQAGCDWFLNWFGAGDNPTVVYQRIACPSEIMQRSGLSDPG